MDVSRIVPVHRVVRESSRHVTVEFEDDAIASYRPGQFVMVWVPGVDEVPMALWGGGDEPLKMLVEAKGDCTRALAGLVKGDQIGIRGPYGRGFELRGHRILAVVGGTGTSPLVPFCQEARGRADVDVAIGGRTREFVLLAKEFQKAGGRVHVSTDDGSEGFHGRAPDLAKQLLGRRRYDEIVTCGPELMMRAVVDEALRRRLPAQAALERWMKCAIGICDACLVDGLRLCREGPVLSAETLATLGDFGRFEREPSGLRRSLH